MALGKWIDSAEFDGGDDAVMKDSVGLCCMLYSTELKGTDGLCEVEQDLETWLVG